MHTKADYEKLIASKLSQYPTVSMRFRAGDPVVSQHLLAMAQMLALMSQQIELGSMEPFEKARDTTVLADAALKGVLQRATPAKIKVSVANYSTDSEYVLQAGRRLLDTSGRYYEVSAPVSVPASGTVDAELVQQYTNVINHEVSASKAFYKILIPPPDSGRQIAGVHVSDSSGNVFEYRERYTNVEPDERVYHVEIDEKQNTYIVFGYALPDGSPVVGYQPEVGEQIRLIIYETEGDFQLAAGSGFVFEYAELAQDAQVQITMVELLEPGKNKRGIAEIRSMLRYPSIYDHNAVHLNNFDFLLRRNIPGFNFLAVWNEQIEEKISGPSVSHIKKLFIAFDHDGDHDEVKERIIAAINTADDSWRFKFFEPTLAPLQIVVSAKVARVHAIAAIQEEVRQLILLNYGKGSEYSKQSMDVPTHQEVSDVLKANVAALQDAATDFTIQIQTIEPLVPDHWHYAIDSSVAVNVEYGNYAIQQWGR